MNVWQKILTPRAQLPQRLRHLLRWRLDAIRRFISLVLVGLLLSVAIAACSGGGDPTATNSASSKEIELTLVGYAIPKAAHDAIIPKFVEQWQKDHNGQNVVFRQSYGGSGTQTRAVIDGLEADVVHLALGADMLKLVKAGLVKEDWNKTVPNHGIVGQTVAAIVTREGNPKGIKDWSDLAKDGVKWVTANPKTSGGARWNFLALWNHALKGGDEAKAKEFVTKAFQNVAVLAKDARESTDAFAKQGQGDALINYENEVILSKAKGEKLDYVVPAVNISIDTPVAVVSKNAEKHGTQAVAEAFVKYLFTPESQQEFVKVGFRPFDPALAQQKDIAAQFPAVKSLAKIDEFGGWGDVQSKFFEDGALFDQVEASLKR